MLNPSGLRTRIAPTPSGFLHQGNLVNFQLTAAAATELGLGLALRIDDIDTDRVRPQYIKDIFDWLHRLGISWSIGPASPADLTSNWSQSSKHRHYWQQLERLAEDGGGVFVCSCSRIQLRDGHCVAGCIAPLSAWQAQVSVVRVHTPNEIGLGDVVLWRRDGIPAYHLTNLVDDKDLGITHVIRGSDLAQSSKFHQWLNGFFDLKISYAHHPLLLAESGSKLSKSQGTVRLLPEPKILTAVADAAAGMLPDVLKQLRGTS